MADRRWAAALLGASLTLAVAGCGSHTTSTTATAKVTTTTTATATSTTSTGEKTPPSQPTLPHDATGTTSTQGTVPLPPAPTPSPGPGHGDPVPATNRVELIEVDTPKVLDVVAKTAHFTGSVDRRYTDLRVVFSTSKQVVWATSLKVACPKSGGAKARCTFDQVLQLSGHVPVGNYTVEVGVPQGSDLQLGPVVPLPLTVHAS